MGQVLVNNSQGGVDRVSDDDFDGVTGDRLPEVDADFSCKKGGTPVNADVLVDIKHDVVIDADLEDDSLIAEQWVRIPVTEVEQWINKDGPADINRTAKVSFPMQWNSVPILRFINGFLSQNQLADQADPYDECRIFFWNHDEENWTIAHYGYIGGIGPAGSGKGKFWVYDPADLMKGITVSKNWGEPTLQEVLDFAINGVDSQNREVGISRRSVFDDIPTTVLGKTQIPRRKQGDVRDTFDDTFVVKLDLPQPVGAVEISLKGFAEDIFEWVNQNFIQPLLGGQKSFQINRHNMVDHMEWVTSMIDARWWFEPSIEGPTLVIDATAFKSGAEKGSYERRYFVDDGAIEQWRDTQRAARYNTMVGEADRREDGITDDDIDDILGGPEEQGNFIMENIFSIPDDYLPPHNFEIYSTVDILNNNALADIKPFNTMYLYGEATAYRERFDAFKSAGAPGAYTNEYPWVKVQYPLLLERAGGYEYSTQPVESDQVYLEEARSEAIKEFRKHIAEVTEGSMEIRGEPHILPYDFLVAMPVCDDIYPDVDAEPIAWEVNGVKHTRKAGERYTTELGVSIAIEESLLDVEAEYKEA